MKSILIDDLIQEAIDAKMYVNRLVNDEEFRTNQKLKYMLAGLNPNAPKTDILDRIRNRKPKN